MPVCASPVCVTLSLVQVRLLLLEEVFSTSHPFRCGKERGVSERCFALSSHGKCEIGQEIVSVSQIFLHCSEISGIGFVLQGISYQCNGAAETAASLSPPKPVFKAVTLR